MVSTGFLSSLKTKPGLAVKTILLSPWLLLALAAALWVFSLQFFDLPKMQDWGLLSIFPPAIIAAYVLLIFGFASLFLRKYVSDAVFSFYILALIVMIHGTPQLLYGTLRYSWAWKHVGIVDYIIRHGAVDPLVDILPVYHNWPGFFALSALFTQLSGFSSAHVYAGWGPVFFEILFAFGLFALFRLFTEDRRLQWLGVWFFLLANWVGQDYFAPQAMTYFMGIGLLIIAIQGFGPKGAKGLNARKKNFFYRFFAKRAKHLKLPLIPDDSLLTTKASRLALGILTLLIFAGIVSSHQLTPFMGVASVLVLVFLGVTRWRTLPLWMIVLIVLWLAFPADSYRDQLFGTSNEVGSVSENVGSGLINVAKVSPGQAVVSAMGRGLTALVVLLAGFGVFQRMRKGYLDLPVIPLAGAPVIMLFLNSYGGEALFRVYLFMTPYLSFLIAGAVLPQEKTDRNWFQPTVIGGLSLVMIIGFLFAYYGKESQYYFSKAEVEASEYLYSQAVPDSLLVEGSRNYPSQFLNYDFFTYVPIDREPSSDKLLADPVGVLDRWLSNTTRYRESYLIITRSQKIAVDELGDMPPGSFDKIQKLLTESEMFEVVFSNDDAIIFRAVEGK
ncbi:MAG: hypothetical protein JNK26_04895 [Candidatus Doudnabacteria bacterium]|nr:hypothetical protein [Candidatus Doudnabacteria bacterium]